MVIKLLHPVLYFVHFGSVVYPPEYLLNYPLEYLL